LERIQGELKGDILNVTQANPYISVVIPVYDSAESLNELYDRLQQALSSLTEKYEIIMVNDASPDQSWGIIESLAENDPRVKGINFSRNFGQHFAITAGLDFAGGEWIVVMDCDLQDQPEEIAKLHQKAQEGFDVVVGRRVQRKERWFKKLCSKIFYKVYDYFTYHKTDSTISSFGIYSRKAIDSIKSLREQNRSFGLFAIWIGFPRIEVEVDHAARKYGKTSYSMSKMIALAIDSIVSHSNKPLKLSIQLGFLMALSSLIYALWRAIGYFFWATPIAGWTSLIVSLYLLAGLILGSIGMLGLYIGKIFDEVKGRPLYIIQSKTFE
jgi:polyisoprenyl-phosphate glycosyltransferase